MAFFARRLLYPVKNSTHNAKNKVVLVVIMDTGELSVDPVAVIIGIIPAEGGVRARRRVKHITIIIQEVPVGIGTT